MCGTCTLKQNLISSILVIFNAKTFIYIYFTFQTDSVVFFYLNPAKKTKEKLIIPNISKEEKN